MGFGISLSSNYGDLLTKAAAAGVSPSADPPLSSYGLIDRGSTVSKISFRNILNFHASLVATLEGVTERAAYSCRPGFWTADPYETEDLGGNPRGESGGVHFGSFSEWVEHRAYRARYFPEREPHEATHGRYHSYELWRDTLVAAVSISTSPTSWYQKTFTTTVSGGVPRTMFVLGPVVPDSIMSRFQGSEGFEKKFKFRSTGWQRYNDPDSFDFVDQAMYDLPSCMCLYESVSSFGSSVSPSVTAFHAVNTVLKSMSSAINWTYDDSAVVGPGALQYGFFTWYYPKVATELVGSWADFQRMKDCAGVRTWGTTSSRLICSRPNLDVIALAQSVFPFINEFWGVIPVEWCVKKRSCYRTCEFTCDSHGVVTEGSDTGVVASETYESSKSRSNPTGGDLIFSHDVEGQGSEKITAAGAYTADLQLNVDLCKKIFRRKTEEDPAVKEILERISSVEQEIDYLTGSAWTAYNAAQDALLAASTASDNFKSQVQDDVNNYNWPWSGITGAITWSGAPTVRSDTGVSYSGGDCEYTVGMPSAGVSINGISYETLSGLSAPAANAMEALAQNYCNTGYLDPEMTGNLCDAINQYFESLGFSSGPTSPSSVQLSGTCTDPFSISGWTLTMEAEVGSATFTGNITHTYPIQPSSEAIGYAEMCCSSWGTYYIETAISEDCWRQISLKEEELEELQAEYEEAVEAAADVYTEVPMATLLRLGAITLLGHSPSAGTTGYPTYGEDQCTITRSATSRSVYSTLVSSGESSSESSNVSFVYGEMDWPLDEDQRTSSKKYLFGAAFDDEAHMYATSSSSGTGYAETRSPRKYPDNTKAALFVRDNVPEDTSGLIDAIVEEFDPDKAAGIPGTAVSGASLETYKNPLGFMVSGASGTGPKTVVEPTSLNPDVLDSLCAYDVCIYWNHYRSDPATDRCPEAEEGEKLPVRIFVEDVNDIDLSTTPPRLQKLSVNWKWESPTLKIGSFSGNDRLDVYVSPYIMKKIAFDGSGCCIRVSES